MLSGHTSRTVMSREGYVYSQMWPEQDRSKIQQNEYYYRIGSWNDTLFKNNLRMPIAMEQVDVKLRGGRQ